MSIKLVSHLGELLYKDSVAQRDAKIARDTEEARQRSATDALAREQRIKALAPQTLMQALGYPSRVASGTGLEDLFPQTGQPTEQSDQPTGVGADMGMQNYLAQLAQQMGVDEKVLMAAMMNITGAQDFLKEQIHTGAAGTREEQKTSIENVGKYVDTILTDVQDAQRSRAEIDAALKQLDTTGTGLFSLDGLSALPVSNPILQTVLAQLRSPEGERLRRFLGNRFKDIRDSAFGGRIFAAEVPAALDAVPGITDRPEVIRAALKAIELGVDYKLLLGELYQELKGQERAGQLIDQRGMARRISEEDILELQRLAIEMLELDAEDEIAEVNQILGQ